MQKVLRVAWCYLAPHIFRAHATQHSETLLLETSSISELKDICGWPSMSALPLTVVFQTLEAQHRRPYNMTPSPGRPRGPAHNFPTSTPREQGRIYSASACQDVRAIWSSDPRLAGGGRRAHSRSTIIGSADEGRHRARLTSSSGTSSTAADTATSNTASSSSSDYFGFRAVPVGDGLQERGCPHGKETGMSTRCAAICYAEGIGVRTAGASPHLPRCLDLYGGFDLLIGLATRVRCVLYPNRSEHRVKAAIVKRRL
ncbi:hypothetical protein BD311DRAFT_248184 [Dichomitus squalens]|uniref:Uncharacterized protein n=1 Tax=Dichomitus squalens TaxID=114155 RepID=A0A4Q9MTR2_9APHY|nr:hypothetical protein BD311DRAFT_248184 [Dichomitus squalens]